MHKIDSPAYRPVAFKMTIASRAAKQRALLDANVKQEWRGGAKVQKK